MFRLNRDQIGYKDQTKCDPYKRILLYIYIIASSVQTDIIQIHFTIHLFHFALQASTTDFVFKFNFIQIFVRLVTSID